MGKKRQAKKLNPQTTKSRAGTTPLPGTAALRFPPSGDHCGLTPVSLSISSDKESPSIVREIVQNSLDAATTAGRKSAYVRFSLENILLDDIPGINEYRKAVNAVANVYERLNWPEQSKDIIDGWQKGLKREEIPVLIVTDNGIGLDKKTMMAILSDGHPEHGKTQSTGSHGNGHFTTFNLSEMRYILYGGISADGKQASGHAILASHQNGSSVCGKDGYYVSKITNDITRPHVFAEGKNIPELILNQLNKIESEWGTGTTIIVPDFNYFGEEERNAKKTTNMILKAVAQNFFVAIQRGGLVVSVRTDKGEELLDAESIQEIMENMEIKIPRVKGFPNYDVANRFSRLYADCENKDDETGIVDIDTGYGKFEFRYRIGDGVGDTKIVLCRNGMWITADIPLIERNRFMDNVPFEGLLLCDAGEKGGDLHDYVRKAEGNLHNALILKLIQDKNKRKILRGILTKTREFIQNHIEKQDLESMEFFEVNSDSIGLSPPKRETVMVIKEGPIGRGKSKKKKGTGKLKGGVGRGSGNPLMLRFTAVRNDKNRMKIRIMSKELAADVELRLSVNGGGDVSCVNASIDNEHIIIERAECDGNPCVVKDGCARLGEIKEGDSKIIEVTYSEPPIRGDYRIDCELLRRARVPS